MVLDTNTTIDLKRKVMNNVYAKRLTRREPLVDSGREAVKPCLGEVSACTLVEQWWFRYDPGAIQSASKDLEGMLPWILFGIGTTEEVRFPADEGLTDWDRWHDLLDIREQRALTIGEQAEYERFARIVARLDAEAAGTADAALDDRVKDHERVLASIRRLTAAVRAAAEER